jgi:ribosome maturation factor RimP
MPNNKTSEQALEAVTALADEIVQKLGMSLVDIHFGQIGRQKSMDVFIYRREGKVSLSDCETVSRELDLKLEQLQDQVTFFHGPYVLNVASPGIDRVLKSEREFDIFRGLTVEVKTKTNVSEGSLGQHFIGTLEKVADDAVHLSSVKPAPQKTFGNVGKGNKKISHKKTIHQETIKTLVVPLKQVIQVRLHPDLLNNLKKLQEQHPVDLSLDSGQDIANEHTIQETDIAI